MKKTNFLVTYANQNENGDEIQNVRHKFKDTYKKSIYHYVFLLMLLIR